MGKVSQYFKWLFTRWYLYVIALISFVSSTKGENISNLINTEPSYLLGSIIGSLLVSALIILIVYEIIKLFKK